MLLRKIKKLSYQGRNHEQMISVNGHFGDDFNTHDAN